MVSVKIYKFDNSQTVLQYGNLNITKETKKKKKQKKKKEKFPSCVTI